MTKRIESLPSSDGVELFTLAEQLLDSPEQLAHYNTAKWNIVGHPDPDYRRDGEMPWLTRRTGEGALRAYTLDVFSGFNVTDETVLTIRKDRWTDPNIPSTWLALQTSLQTGETVQRDIWSARVDAVRNMWLEIAPLGARSQPVWNSGNDRAFRSRSTNQQHRIEARLDENWQTDFVEFRAGTYGGTQQYEDIVALEAMIITVQQTRMLQQARAHQPEEASLLALAA